MRTFHTVFVPVVGRDGRERTVDEAVAYARESWLTDKSAPVTVARITEPGAGEDNYRVTTSPSWWAAHDAVFGITSEKYEGA